jgi:hypothetical protein
MRDNTLKKSVQVPFLGIQQMIQILMIIDSNLELTKTP